MAAYLPIFDSTLITADVARGRAVPLHLEYGPSQELGVEH